MQVPETRQHEGERATYISERKAVFHSCPNYTQLSHGGGPFQSLPSSLLGLPSSLLGAFQSLYPELEPAPSVLYLLALLSQSVYVGIGKQLDVFPSETI